MELQLGPGESHLKPSDLSSQSTDILRADVQAPGAAEEDGAGHGSQLTLLQRKVQDSPTSMLQKAFVTVCMNPADSC